MVFSGLLDPRPFKPTLPVDPTSGRQLPHYETKAQIKVTNLCWLSSQVPCGSAPSVHVLTQDRFGMTCANVLLFFGGHGIVPARCHLHDVLQAVNVAVYGLPRLPFVCSESHNNA